MEFLPHQDLLVRRGRGGRAASARGPPRFAAAAWLLDQPHRFAQRLGGQGRARRRVGQLAAAEAIGAELRIESEICEGTHVILEFD